MRITVFTLLLFSIFACGGGDDPKPSITLPSDLTVNVVISADKSGKVDITAAATKANFYSIYFGDVSNEVPTKSSSGEVTHTYAASGDYTITVRAHATEAAYITETKAITITLASDTEIPTTGYTTPLTYEGKTLVWNDEFDGTTLNSDYWTHESGNGTNGWGNNELQYYRSQNTTVEDGYLIITAKKESYGGKDYTSSRIITKDKKSFQYGRIDIRAVLPKGQGIWPALWMLGSNFSTAGWPACGEIDIMELIGGGAGRDNKVYGTLHWDNNGSYASYGQSYTLSSGIFKDEFHVFSMVWNETKIIWYVDDIKFNEVDITPAGLSEFKNSFFFIFNIAVGGNWPGSPNGTTVFPQRMVVDYVRVFQ